MHNAECTMQSWVRADAQNFTIVGEEDFADVDGIQPIHKVLQVLLGNIEDNQLIRHLKLLDDIKKTYDKPFFDVAHKSP